MTEPSLQVVCSNAESEASKGLLRTKGRVVTLCDGADQLRTAKQHRDGGPVWQAFMICHELAARQNPAECLCCSLAEILKQQ